MIKYGNDFFTIENVLSITKKRKPDFNEFLKVLKREKPSRHTLFEFFLNDDLYSLLLGSDFSFINSNHLYKIKLLLRAFRNAGYDYATIPANFQFSFREHSQKKSISQNETVMIYDKKSFYEYDWPKVSDIDFSYLDDSHKILYNNMKYIPFGPGGVLENATMLLGYENMCYMIFDEPELVSDVFQKVGETLFAYYDNIVDYPTVGAVISNDDWGYKSQTMLKVEDMKKYVIPWHKKIVDRIHKAGKPAILHSCGNLEKVMDDIIDHIGYDAKHSYEDNILPVEDFYDLYKDRIAILGGIDLNYVCTKEPFEVFERSAAMLKKTEKDGGYALGSGNSIPYYVPVENYCALILAGLIDA